LTVVRGVLTLPDIGTGTVTDIGTVTAPAFVTPAHR